eukprot:CAMPEP_0170632250 /NCGR_PEP_ID=MMETSP0224-20130122/35216_1 /TAXON_ID=285029 /ORGANISM="Togula jolla, Strain CCCM 725" /LENGTH=89 /DNA_ID=CAMNT_0010960927 /DNA_START=165 /DNA_END=435 /DNA_ORIENTATION=-
MGGPRDGLNCWSGPDWFAATEGDDSLGALDDQSEILTALWRYWASECNAACLTLASGSCESLRAAELASRSPGAATNGSACNAAALTAV